MFSRSGTAGFFAALTLVAVGAGYAVAAVKSPSYSVSPLPDPFRSYVVSVKSLQLVDTSGKKVEVVPTPISIDFAQVLDLDEAVNAGLIPSGDYTAATMILDYSKSEITGTGATAGVAKLKPYDSNGSPITGTRTVKMRLDGYRHFVVSTRTAALLALDPRLVASNKIDSANGTVTVGDSWAATVVPSGNQWVRLTGGLTVVNGTSSSFVLTVGTRRAYNTVATGDIKLLGSPTTAYTIGGQAYTGNAGEIALATYPKGTSVTATGSLQPDRKSIVASIVVVN